MGILGLAQAVLVALSLGTAHGTDAARNNHSEIVFTDSQAAVLMADSVSGGPMVVAAGQKLIQPFGIAVANNGELLVSDTGCMGLLGVDPVSKSQRVVSSGGSLGVPFGIAVERDGTILVANAQALLRIDQASGAQTIASSGQLFRAPIAVAVAANGQIFVVDLLGSVIQVDPATGAQSLVASGGYLKRPQGIAVSGDHIYVTDVGTSDGNFGLGRIIHINFQTRQQSVLSEGGYLVGPVGIAVADAGDLVIGDPYTINPQSLDLADGGFDGAIIRVNRANGSQNLVARGRENFVNPRCVAIVNSAAAAN